MSVSPGQNGESPSRQPSFSSSDSCATSASASAWWSAPCATRDAASVNGSVRVVTPPPCHTRQQPEILSASVRPAHDALRIWGLMEGCPTPSCTRSPSRPGSSSSRSPAARAPCCGTPTATSSSTRWPACGTAPSATGGREIADAVADADAHDRGLLVLRPVHQRARPTQLAETLVALTPDARRPRVLLPARAREAVDSAMKLARLAHVPGRPPRAHADHLAATAAITAPTTAARAPRASPRTRRATGRSSPTSCRCRATTSRRWPSLMAEHAERDRRRAHRAGAGRRRRLPAGRRLPRRAAPAVRPARRVPDLRRGDHRVRPPRHVVRRRTTTACSPT